MLSRIVIAAIAVVGLSGCATIVQGSKQTMSVNTKPEDGAKCELKNATGTWYVTTPGSVEVHKTKTDLQITCSKDGVGKGSAVAKATFGGTTFGNVLAGGVIGVVVDAASGADFYYESPVVVVLTADAGAPATAEAGKPANGTVDGKPGDVKPTDTKPADAKPADTIPADAKPADGNVTDAKPADVKPADVKPDAKPADVKPADAKPADAAAPADAKPAAAPAAK